MSILAAQHASDYGHRVYVELCRVTRYELVPAPQPSDVGPLVPPVAD
jgi:hypothetical protein